MLLRFTSQHSLCQNASVNLSWNLTRDVAVFRFYQCERDVCVTKTVRIHMYGAPWADLRFCFMSVKQFGAILPTVPKPFGRQSVGSRKPFGRSSGAQGRQSVMYGPSFWGGRKYYLHSPQPDSGGCGLVVILLYPSPQRELPSLVKIFKKKI